jgi:protein-disulfide isomerase
MHKLKVPIGKRDHIKGSMDAPVTVVEYGDFECPYCGEAYPIVKRIQEEMGDKLCLVFRNFPLKELHSNAFSAACAAEAAGKQNKFWEMHDMLFENQDALHDVDLQEYAEALDLDIDQFIKDMRSEEIAKRVQEDFMNGARSGVNGTPTFYINGIRYDGSNDYDTLLEELERG